MEATVTEVRSRDFIARMDCHAGDRWLPDAVSQLQSWLRLKDFDVDLSEWADHEVAHRILRVRPMPEGKTRELHVTLEETHPNTGGWQTDLILHDEAGDRDWISLTVSSAEGSFVAVPHLARYLMQVLPLTDGQLEFTDSPQIFGVDDLDRLVALLEDQQRHGLVFVAGTAHTGLPFQPFASKVGEWAHQVFGLAQVIVLDPDATTAFASRVGHRFAAPPWAIRTYHPSVTFEDLRDSRRHRILGTERLASQRDGAIKTLLGDIARQQAATRPVDPALLRARRRRQRLETARLVDAVESSVELPSSTLVEHVSPVVPVEPSPRADDAELVTARTQLELVRSVLGLDEVTEDALRRVVASARRPAADRAAFDSLRTRVDALQTEMERAEDARQELLEALEDAQMEAEIFRIDLERREGRVKWLEQRLKEAGDYETGYQDVPDEFLESRPESFSELLDRLEQLDSLVFTGDPTEVERLNQIDTNDAALRTTWDAILAMCDYTRARREGACDQGLDHYLSHTPSGYRTFPPGKFGETETGTTMRSFGAERVFAVPEDVASTGEVVMKAHFKLARIGMASPRMYIHDCHPDDSLIVIGYIGPHLTNTHTR